MKYIKILLLSTLFISSLQTSSLSRDFKMRSTMDHGNKDYGKNKNLLNKKAPFFYGLTSKGKKVFSKRYLNKNNILLVFYPGDNTPVCTNQLSDIRDKYQELEKINIKVFGVNPANKESHNKFINDHDFQFDLIIDEGQKIAKKYNALNKFGFISRTVVLINKQGKVVLYEKGVPELSSEMLIELIK